MSGERVTNWLSEARHARGVAVRVGRRGDELIAEFAHLGRLTIHAGGTRAEFEPVSGVNGAVLEKARRTIVDAFVRHAQGKVTLHAGAVSLDSCAVAFVGPSRSGKSTLVAAMCSTKGARLVADDTLPIEFSQKEPAGAHVLEVAVGSSQAGAWLLPDARRQLGFDSEHRGKRAVTMPAAPSGGLALGAIVELVFDPEAARPELRRLRGQEAFAAVFGSAVRFVLDDRSAQLREFEQLQRLVRACPIYQLRRRIELGQLEETAERVIEVVADPLGGAR